MMTQFKTTALAIFATLFFSSFLSCVPTQGLDDMEGFIPHSGQSIFDRMHHQEIVEMTLTANLDSLISVRNTEDFSTANLSYEDELGGKHRYQVMVKPRGKFRRRVCDMPPLKIKFSKDELEAAGLAKHNDFKLVTHCLNGEAFDDELVLREYLAYQLYNELTPQSFRTQLVKITYRDVNDRRYKLTRFGFLIEDTDELAERMGAEECEDCYGIAPELYRPNAERISALFQYMIGNVDWSLEMNRNVKQMAMPDGTYVPVPYDFDFAVMVGAPYLRPSSDVDQSPNMERIFMGYASSTEELYSTLAYFKTKQADLLNIVRGFKWLEEADRLAIAAYLDSFFKNLDGAKASDEMIFRRANSASR